MTISSICSQEIVKVERTAAVTEAIKLMRNKHVGDVVVVSNERPIGILTDRDIVVKILCNNVDPDSLAVSDAMSYDLVTVPANVSILEALGIMRIKGVRRAPVTDSEGNLIGIISIDDIISQLAEELNELTLLLRNERKREQAVYFAHSK